MAGEARAALESAWRRMREYYDWQLAADEEALLARATVLLVSVSPGASEAARARTALTRAYGELMHWGLVARQERAAYELWLAFWRLGLRRGAGEDAAYELAQEAMARVLAALGDLRSPQSLVFWAFKIFGSVAREADAARQEPATTGADEGGVEQMADPHDLAGAVEQAAVDVGLLALLERKLPNELERTVVRRVVLGGANPRDVARDLGLPLHRTRVAKARALKRLRDDEELAALLRDLADDPSLQRERGASDDDPEG